MNRSIAAVDVIREQRPRRFYGTSILKAADGFWVADREVGATTLADALREREGVEAVALLGEGEGVVGLVSRERLFGLLTKPFGREVLGRIPAREIAEPCPVYDARRSLFEVANEFLAEDPVAERCLLVGEGGRFEGVLSATGLSSYLARMTCDDVSVAAVLQERLLASGAASGPGWRLGSWSKAARGVGGDFWYGEALPDGRAFMALCDVSGKGVAASLVVAMAWGMIRAFDLERGLPALVSALNETIVSAFHLERYLTGFFAFYDPRTRVLEAADMGHSHVMVIRRGEARRLAGSGSNLPVGLEPELVPAIARWRLREGDVMAAYTDGLTEQADPDGLEFGEAGLARAGARAWAEGRALEDVVPGALEAFARGAPQQDDITLLALTLAGGAPTND